MAIAWCVAPGVVCRFCPGFDECLVYSSFSGTAHVIGNVGLLVVDLCRQGPQTMESLIAGINEAFETEQPDDLTNAAKDTVQQLQSLGILAQCAPR